jgi:hypothetical protein
MNDYQWGSTIDLKAASSLVTKIFRFLIPHHKYTTNNACKMQLRVINTNVNPNEDFFPDIDNLFGNMSLTDDNTNGGSASAPAPTPYVFLIFAFVLQFLGLAIDLDMLDMFCSYRSLVNMVSLISMFLAILCLLFSWIKYHGKLLISPTEQWLSRVHNVANLNKAPSPSLSQYDLRSLLSIIDFLTNECTDTTIKIINHHHQKCQHKYAKEKQPNSLVDIAREHRVQITIVEDIVAEINIARTTSSLQP